MIKVKWDEEIKFYKDYIGLLGIRIVLKQELGEKVKF